MRESRIWIRVLLQDPRRFDHAAEGLIIHSIEKSPLSGSRLPRVQFLAHATGRVVFAAEVSSLHSRKARVALLTTVCCHHHLAGRSCSSCWVVACSGLPWKRSIWTSRLHHHDPPSDDIGAAATGSAAGGGVQGGAGQPQRHFQGEARLVGCGRGVVELRDDGSVEKVRGEGDG